MERGKPQLFKCNLEEPHSQGPRRQPARPPPVGSSSLTGPPDLSLPNHFKSVKARMPSAIDRPPSQAKGPAQSLGMRQSPRGDRATDPTLGPSGMAERLNCWLAKRPRNKANQGSNWAVE